MKSTDAPSKQAVPFGTNGPREAITATTPSGSNQASYDQGFPPITMTLKSAGGLPPKGQDMNQILFEQSSFNRYFAAGGGYVYDSTFSTAVGGYPLSARIPNSTGTGFWFNTVEDNQTNPENSTSALTGWIPMGSYGVTALTGLTSASVTLTTLQASKERITLAGTLTANINIVVPAWIKRWEVVNNCVGAFSVTIKTPSGTGVAVASGSNAIVYGDGVNVTSAFPPGSLVNVQTFTSSGTYNPTPGTKKTFREVLGAGGGGGGVSATASGNLAIAAGGGAGGYCAGWVNNPVSTTVTVGTGGAGGIGSISASGGGLAGSDGGLSSVGSLVANGGKGGTGNGTTVITSGTTTLKVGAEGGTATGGDINMKGNASPMSAATTVGNSVSGYGASSIFGGGNPGGFGNVSSNGIDASANGAGGSGAYSTQSPTNLYNGGKGGNGLVRIWEFA